MGLHEGGVWIDHWPSPKQLPPSRQCCLDTTLLDNCAMYWKVIIIERSIFQLLTYKISFYYKSDDTTSI